MDPNDYTTRPLVTILGECPECGYRLALRHSSRDGQPFLGCTQYPRCRFSARFDDTLQDLADRLARAEAEIEFLRRQRHPVQAADMVGRHVIDRELRRLAAACHPDRWSGSPVAEEATKQVLDLRQRVQGGNL